MKNVRKGIAGAFAVAVTMLALAAAPATAGEGRPGAVYTMTNSATGNAVAVFARGGDGQLTPRGTVSTGGLGSGSGLGSQGALVLSDNGR
jgi:6-phosphogluconolactonase